MSRMFPLPALALAGFALLAGAPAWADDDANCPAGYRYTGDEAETTASGDTILHAICKRIKKVTCREGYSPQPAANPDGVVCTLDTSMRPAPTKEEQLVSLRRQAAEELSESKYHNMKVYFAGLKAIFAGDEQEPDAEEESREAAEHFEKYIELKKQIEELNGNKPGELYWSSREKEVYIREPDKTLLQVTPEMMKDIRTIPNAPPSENQPKP